MGDRNLSCRPRHLVLAVSSKIKVICHLCIFIVISGADLENEKGGFFCMHTLRAGENFAQPRPFLSQSAEVMELLAVELANNLVGCAALDFSAA